MWRVWRAAGTPRPGTAWRQRARPPPPSVYPTVSSQDIYFIEARLDSVSLFQLVAGVSRPCHNPGCGAISPQLSRQYLATCDV